jgi:type IV secretory pathway protease TraF
VRLWGKAAAGENGSSRPVLRRLPVGGAALLGTCLAVVLLFFSELPSSYLAINLTPSLPRGLYRVRRLEVRPGALVTFCLPPEVVRRHDLAKWIAPGRCPGGKAPLLKRIVVVGPGRARCAGVVWAVARGEVFVRGDSPRSEDSCVFGPVPLSWLRGGVEPMWTR